MEYRNLLNYNKKKKEERLLFSVYIFVMCLLLSVKVTHGESSEQPTTLTEAPPPTTTEAPTTTKAPTTRTTTAAPITAKAPTTTEAPSTTKTTTTTQAPTTTEAPSTTETTTTTQAPTTTEAPTTTKTTTTTAPTTTEDPPTTETTTKATQAPSNYTLTVSTTNLTTDTSQPAPDETTTTSKTTTSSITTITQTTKKTGTNLTSTQTPSTETTPQSSTSIKTPDITTSPTTSLPEPSQNTTTESLTTLPSTPASNTITPDSGTSTPVSNSSTPADGTTTKTNATDYVSSTTLAKSSTSTLSPTITTVLENNSTTQSAQKTTKDPCMAIACVNGTCSAENGNATCNCIPGFTGTLCETNINDCLHNPCLNGGACKDEINNYTCQCAVGYNGYNCSNNINDCKDSTCENGGNCTDGVNDFTCQCVPGYGGKNCSIDIDECKSNPCKNTGTCVDGLDEYTCNCPDGFNGTNCGNDIDDCVGVDCLHSGTCQDLVNNYTCKCQKEWEGRHCDEDVDECSAPSHPCHDNAICTNTMGGYNCTCKSGFEGDGHTCTDINECENTTICQNGATCFDTPGSYFCYCSQFWTGTHCETDIDECNNPWTCASGASCNNTKGGYSCECDEGYRGDGHEKCIQETLITVSSATLRQGDDDVFGPIALPEVIYYFGKPFNTFYVNMNGYVTLGNKLNQRYPTMDSTSWRTFDFPIIAPLWSDIQTKGGNSGVSYVVNTDTPTLEVIGKAMNTLKQPSLSIIVTWENAAPYPFDQNAKHENASFQVIISKVDTQTLLMFNYDQELFTWKNTSDKQVVVGYSNSSYNGVLDFGSDSFTDVIKNGSAGINGSWIFNVTSASTDWTEESLCLTAVTNASILTLINNARTTADPCPCGVQQIQRDRRFKKMDVTASLDHRYISRFSRGADKVKQRCHYSREGALLQGNPDGGYVENDKINDVYKKCCEDGKRCNLFFNINPSDNCYSYSPPSWSPSWGDPHIKTIDNATYTFNARGEFILLQTNQSEAKINVQVRTELAKENNTDATVFVGLAAKAGGDVVEVLFNKTSKKCEIYVNGSMNVSNAPTSKKNISLSGMEIHSNQDDKSIYIDFDIGVSIQIIISEILDIVVSVPQEGALKGKTMGLLGNNNENSKDDLRPRNDSSKPLNDAERQSEETIYYKFGLTWRVKEDESLFTYDVPGRNYSYYNNVNIKPSTFISDAISDSNITAYLNKTCGNNKINISRCGGNMACVVDAAATCNESFGLNSKDTEEKAIKEKKTLDHKPPFFELPDPLYIGYSSNSTVTLTTKFPVHVNTSISVAEGISLNNQTEVHLNVSKDLRVTAAYMIVTAKDSMGAVSEYRPDLYYCGCEEESQCDFSLVGQDGPVALSEGKFLRARCNCSDGTTGNYCQEKIDICAGSPCYENVPCNSTSSTPENPCGPCPIGFIGDGMRCYDENECYLETDKCSQLCENIEGSYNCSCETGYDRGNDNFTCNDINECDNNPCQDTNEYCENTVGSFTCRCNPGYHYDNSSKCIKENYAYAGMIVFKTPTDNIDQMEISIKQFLKETYSSSIIKIDVTYIEIVSIYKISVSRRKRAASTPEWQADFVLHTKNKASTGNVSKVLNDKLESLPSDEGFGSISNIPGIVVSLTKSEVYTDKEGGMCNIPGRAPCDPISTICSSAGGKVTCSCKQNFEGLASPYSCKDIDECLNEKTICQGGNCVNSPGSYTCNCNAGYKYDGSQACIDMCSSNPCQNGGQCIHGEVQEQYFCKCDDLWSGAKCEDKNSEAEKLKIIAIAVGGSIGAICLLLLLALFGMYRRHKNRYSGYRRRPLSSMDFDSSFGLSGPNIRTKDFPIDDDTDTGFSIPRPKYNQPGNEMSDIGGASYDRIESEGTEKLEELKKPLTKETEQPSSSGQDNPSFLHSDNLEVARRSYKRESKNAYEYF